MNIIVITDFQVPIPHLKLQFKDANGYDNKDMKKGFTLIELLVVISIVAILSALLMANFIGVRQRSRDATRKSDMQSIRQALELYRADVGSYPSSITCGSQLVNPTTNSIVYMSEIPCDPIASGQSTNYRYTYNNGNGTYTLTACIENSADTENTINSCSGSSDSCCSDPFDGKVSYTNP